MTEREVAMLELRLRDYMSAQMKKAGKTAQTESKRMRGAFGGVSKSLRGMGVLLFGASSGIFALKNAINQGVGRALAFSKSMA